MANFRKREGKNGKISWQVTVEGVRDPVTGERKRYSKTVHGTKKQAMVVARQLEDAILGGNLIAPAPIKLSKWMDDWLTNYLPNIAQTTRDGYEEKIKNYIVPNLGHIPINALTPNHIQSWVNKLQQSGLSPKTIRNAYNNLNAALKKAVVLRMIPHNPCEGVELPKLQRYEAKIYDTTDIQKALDAAKGTGIYLLVLLGVSVGLRRGEIAGLRWKDINFSARTITIKNNRVHAKRGVVQKAPKTKAGKRTISVGSEVISALRDARQDYNAAATAPGFQNLGYVVCKEDGTPYHPDSLTTKWERFTAANNLPHVRLHDLRHSNATALIQAGVSPKVVQQRLGHSDITVTLNTYTHVLPCMDQEAAAKIDDIIFAKPTANA